MNAKRFKREITSFECLPNEFLLETFNYLSDVDTVYAFSQLNQRFQSLILHCCQTFDFQSISKVKFDYIIQQHEITRWQSLRLSDDDRTPTQIMHFYQIFLHRKLFTQMKHLSMINMKPHIGFFALSKLVYFSNLISLTLGFICGHKSTQLYLPTLKYLNINSCTDTQWISNLQVEHVQCTIEHHCKHECNLKWPTTAKQLKIFLSRSGDIESVRNSLNNLSELHTLAIYDSSWENLSPHGQVWEKIIRNSMPKLQKFDFCFKFWKDFNLSSDISLVVSTFATPFYLEEKSWFIQCDSHYQQLSIAMLYSLPFAFTQFDIITHSFDQSISTDKKSQIKSIYEKVQTISVDVNCTQINTDLLSFKIENLSLKFTGIPMDWICSLTHLRRLSIGNHVNMSSKQFLSLLQNALHLNHLNLSYLMLSTLTNNWRSQEICKLLARRISSLNIPSDSSGRDYIKVDELVHIVRVFHQRIQYLNITIRSRNLVAGYILRNLNHLRSLNVRLREHGSDLMITKQWLIEQDSLYAKLNYSLVIDGNFYSFWFGRQRSIGEKTHA